VETRKISFHHLKKKKITKVRVSRGNRHIRDAALEKTAGGSKQGRDEVRKLSQGKNCRRERVDIPCYNVDVYIYGKTHKGERDSETKNTLVKEILEFKDANASEVLFGKKGVQRHSSNSPNSIRHDFGGGRKRGSLVSK